MSDKKDIPSKSAGSSSILGGFSSGNSSVGDTFFFRKSAGQSSTGAVDVSSEIKGVEFNANDFEAMLERYADRAFARLVADVERRHADKFVYIEQAQGKVARQIDQSEKMLKSLETGLEMSTGLIDKAIKDQRDFESEISSVKANAITALSIFVSFFAFITVSINVFSKAANVVSAMVLLTVFWCLLMGFNLLIAMRFKANGGGRAYWIALVLVVLVSFASIAFAGYVSPGSMERVIHFLA